MDAAPETPASAVRAAYEHARQGRLEEAGAICDEVLRQEPRQPDALLLRAIIEVQTGRLAEAVVSIHRLIEGDPSRPAAHALLGDALLGLHRPLEALEGYDAALRLDPRLHSAHYGRGNALLDLQRPQEALGSYDRALALQPDDAEALFNRGNALLRLQRFQEAVDSYDRALRWRPFYAAAFNNRGSALMSLKLAKPALASFEAAVAAEPAFAEALHNRGCALRDLQRPEEALQSFDRALQARPDYPDALVSRGNVLRELRKPVEAQLSFELALKLRPDWADALRGRGDALLEQGNAQEALESHEAAVRFESESAAGYNSRGNSLRALGRYAEAIASYEHALRLEPSSAVAHYNRGIAFEQWNQRPEEIISSYAHALEIDPAFDYLPGVLLYAQRHQADWSVPCVAASLDSIQRAVMAGERAIAPFPFLSVCDSAAAQLACARTYANFRCPPAAPRRSGVSEQRERIRIAYVSSDLREHAVTYLMAGVFERHDPQRFDVIAISLRPAEASVLGQRVERAFGRFIDVSQYGDQQVAELMRALQVDIAVDLNGFTDGSRPQIFAFRAAPIQVNYLGFPATMGSPFMDYLLADSFVIPPESRKHYSERIVYLPDTFQANDTQRPLSARAFTRADAALPERAFIFCCFNNSHKINARMFDVWMRLLAQRPDAMLWLLSHTEPVRANLRREAANRGIDAGRLIFAERLPYPEYLNRLALADLFLDTLPFNAGTTASDALWAGVPVLTCAGEAFAARMAGSVLRAAGLPELITLNLEDYETKALELARHPRALEALRQRLRASRGTASLFDTDRFCRHLESAYEEMWQRHRRGEEPAGFTVVPTGRKA